MKKIGLIALLLIFIVGCEEDDNTQQIELWGDCGSSVQNYEIVSIESANLKLTDGIFSEDEIVEENADVNWSEFLARFEFKTQTLEKKSLKTTLDCVEVFNAIGIDTLYVKTVYDYNNTYKAKDTINNIVGINNYTSSITEFEAFFSISEYIDENNSQILYQNFDLNLKEPPVNDVTPFAVEIEYILNDGEVYRDTTNVVNLLKISVLN